jgi:hypothetical protein
MEGLLWYIKSDPISDIQVVKRGPSSNANVKCIKKGIDSFYCK